MVKILDQYLNPIKSYDEKTIFDDFQKFRRALTDIAVTIPKLKISHQKFGFLMYLRSIKIPAKFEPNRKYAWERPARL